jgi:hypothetical protein
MRDNLAELSKRWRDVANARLAANPEDETAHGLLHCATELEALQKGRLSKTALTTVVIGASFFLAAETLHAPHAGDDQTKYVMTVPEQPATEPPPIPTDHSPEDNEAAGIQLRINGPVASGTNVSATMVSSPEVLKRL